MNKISSLISACLVAGSFASGAQAQTQPASQPASQAQGATDRGITARYVSGEITELVPAENRMTIRTEAGNTVAVALTNATTFKRVQPGATSIESAAQIAIADVGVGDRVIARGTVDTAARAAAAREVIVMTRADLSARREREQAEWRRGVVGTITALDPAKNEITVQPRSRPVFGGGGQAPAIVVAANAPGVVLRRYAPDSVRFQDAKISSFGELKVGDQLRARGERSEDGTRFTPKEIVSGAFRTIAGTVTAVSSDSVTLKPVSGGAPLVVTVKADTTLRRLPEGGMMGMTGGAPGGGRPGAPAAGAQGAPGAGGGNRPPTPGGASGFGGGGRGVDFSEILERLPALTLAELKPGDVIAVSGTAVADQSRLTAVAVLAGVERLVAAAQSQPQQQQGGRGAGQSLGTGLPAGFDLGIGGP